MPYYRFGEPAVYLFTADEFFVLCDWFGIDKPPSERVIEEILDEWDIPKQIDFYRRTDAAVAQILLERVQDRLPNWHGPQGDARTVVDRPAHRQLELVPQHLLTINWADSGPGFSWPVAYKATFVPAFDQIVVTASSDSPEMFGVCDVAIGAFGSDVPFLQGCRDIIVADWSGQRREWDRERWVGLFDTGLVAAAEGAHGLTRSGRLVPTTRKPTSVVSSYEASAALATRRHRNASEDLPEEMQ